jgi:hypothetical protein
MRVICKALSLALSLTLYLPSTLGQARAAIYPVGDVKVTVPFPDGHIELNEIAGDKKRMEMLRAVVKAVEVRPNRLLGMFLPRDEVSSFLRGDKFTTERAYFVVTSSVLESSNLSTKDFQQAADLIRKQTKEFTEALEVAALSQQAQLTSSMEELRQKYRVSKLRMSADTPIPMGVFDDESQSIGVAYLRMATLDMGASKVEILEVQAISACLIKGKILTLGVTSKFQSKDDLEWVKAKAKEWRLQMVAAN